MANTSFLSQNRPLKMSLCREIRLSVIIMEIDHHLLIKVKGLRAEINVVS